MIIEKALAEGNYGAYSTNDASKIKADMQKEKLDWFEQYNRANKAEAEVKDLRAALDALKSALRVDENPTSEDGE